jgi:hypothetical protein
MADLMVAKEYLLRSHKLTKVYSRLSEYWNYK